MCGDILRKEGGEDMSDCISRQDAIAEIYDKYMSSDMAVHNDVVNECMRIIKALPSVTPTGHWIPVSERLPEYDKEVLCFLSSDEYAVCYLTDNWGNDEFVDGGFGTGTYDVVAWMPLPKPYEPQESEDKG